MRKNIFVLFIALLSLTSTQAQQDIIVNVGEQTVQVHRFPNGKEIYVCQYYSYDKSKTIKAFIKETVHAKESTNMWGGGNGNKVIQKEAIIYSTEGRNYQFRGVFYSRISDVRREVVEWILVNS